LFILTAKYDGVIIIPKLKNKEITNFLHNKKITKKGKLSMFADEVALVNVGNNLEKLKEIIETDL